MNIIIVGGGKVGGYFAAHLLAARHNVKVIELRREHVEQLLHDLPSAAVRQGSGTSPAMLETGGIHTAHTVIAVTGTDETNLVVSCLARFEYNVLRIIARLNSPKKHGYSRPTWALILR
jgi:trk system potassium uptake protein TrkA